LIHSKVKENSDSSPENKPNQEENITKLIISNKKYIFLILFKEH